MLAHCNEELSRHELSMIQHLTQPVDQQRSRLCLRIITNLEIYNSWVRIYVPPQRSGFRAVALIGKHWLRHDERIKAALRNLRKIILWRTKNQFHPHGAAFEYWPRGCEPGKAAVRHSCCLDPIFHFPHFLLGASRSFPDQQQDGRHLHSQTSGLRSCDQLRPPGPGRLHGGRPVQPARTFQK